MLNYKYVPNPKTGDLLGYALTREIMPVVVLGFSKQGNIRVIPLTKHSIDSHKKGKQPGVGYWYNPIKSVAKNHLNRVCVMDISSLSQEEVHLYNYLVHNTPMP